MLEDNFMEQKVFFVIDGKELLLDKVLVEYNGTPIFFVCRSEGNFFASICIDMDEERYLIAKVKLSSLSKMLHRNITMRDMILQAEEFWNIVAGEDFAQDIVIKVEKNVLPLDELPYEGEYLEIVTKDLEKYVEKIDSILYGEDSWNREKSSVQYVLNENVDIAESQLIEIVSQIVYQSVVDNIKSSKLTGRYDMSPALESDMADEQLWVA